MADPRGVRPHQRIDFKILFSITALIIAIELVLLLFSLSARKNELFSLRDMVHQNVAVRMAHISKEEVLPSEQIETIVQCYARNIALMVVLILAVVIGGTYLITRQILIKPIMRVYRANLELAHDHAAGSDIPEEEFPGDEIGMIMHSRKRMLMNLESQHREIEAAKERIERQNGELTEQYERLKELEGLRDNLTHMIVHDMRSPLAGMQGYLDLIDELDSEKLSEDGRRFLAGALETTASLNEMMSSLLDVSRLEAGEMPLNIGLHDLGGLVQDSLGLLGSLVLRTRVVYEPPEREVVVSCDRDIVLRVITNIVSNSVKFTPKDGEVRIDIAPENSEVKVAVADTGPGIPEEFHEKIFEKFGQVEARERRQKYSTGLGLTFCKLAVEAHGGRIGLTSEMGAGSVFWFTLPTGKA